MFLSENVCVPKASIQNSFRFMQPVPFDEEVIRKELSFVRFEIVINKGSGQRRGSGWETGQRQNCQNHVMHRGRCFPIIIDVGVQFPVLVSPPSAIDVRSIYSLRMSQLAFVDCPNGAGESSNRDRSKSGDDGVFLKNISANATLKSFENYQARKGFLAGVATIIFTRLL